MRSVVLHLFVMGLAAGLAAGCASQEDAKGPPTAAAEPAAVEVKPPPPAPEKAAAPARPKSPTDCGPPIDGLDALLEKPGLLLIGELHGTREIPATIGRIVCAASARRPVRLGVELSRAEQARIDRFMASGGEAAARDDLTDGQPWRWTFQDGRTSVALVDLLERIRALRAAGRDVAAFGYDVVRFDGATTRDKGMADFVITARKALPEATFIVVSGNRHTQIRSEPGPPGEPAFVPMGAHLAAAFEDVVALDARTNGGEFWACIGPDPTSCGPQKRAFKPSTRDGIYIDRQTRPLPPGHHGVLHVGRATVSPPARK